MKEELKNVSGPLFRIPKKDVDTDQIIPARYLTKAAKRELKPFCLEGCEFDGFDRESPLFKQAKVLVVGENFGCGSSREHAVWALQEWGFEAVVGTTFARIFYQNAIACGLCIITLKPEEILGLMEESDGTPLTIDFESAAVTAGARSYRFTLDPFDKTLLASGGLVTFAYYRYIKRGGS